LNSRDLFEKFNVDKAGSGCRVERVLVLGPPRSGKTTFIDRYLKGCGKEHTVGLIKTVKVPKQPSRIEMIINIFKKLERVSPLLEKANYVPIDVSTEGLDKLGREGVDELKKLLGDEAPKHIVKDIANKFVVTRSGSAKAYYIPWDINEELLDEDVRKAVEIIRGAFKASGAKVKWLNAEYIPPGFVKEVLELLNREEEEKVREIVRDKVDAYVSFLKSLDLLDKVEWESHFVTSARTFIMDTAGRSLAIIPYIAGNILLGAFTTVLITLFTDHIIKTPQGKDLAKVIDLKINLEKLKAEKPSNEVCGEFSELGKIIAYKIAAALNHDVEDVCKALAEIAGIELEELRKIVEGLSNRITEVEEKLKLTRFMAVTGIIIVDRSEFIEGEERGGEGLLYPDIKVVDGKLSIRVGKDYYSVVEAGAFGTAINNLINWIRERRVVVVVGPRGIGKSVLVASAIWRLFDNGDIGLVAGVKELNEYNDSHFTRFIENYLRGFRRVFGELLILYDPSITRVYEKERERQPIPEDIRKSIDNLLEITSSFRENLIILIVLPKDIYNVLGEDIRKALDQYKLELDLRDAEFLAEVVKEYSNVCRDKLDENKLSVLAKEIANFDEGYVLIARLAGTLLAEEFNCNIDDVSKVVDESKHKATAFIASFINSYFKITDEDRARVLAEIFAIRKPSADIESPGDPVLTPGIVKIIKSVVNPGFEMPDEKARWLSVRQHDLIEHAIENLLSKKNLGKASEVWTRTEIPKITGTKEAVEYFINTYGKRFAEELNEYSKCWRRLALITSHALTRALILPRKEDLSDVLGEYLKKGFDNLKKSLEEALSSCAIDYYLIVDNKIPIFVHILVAEYLSPKRFDDFWKNFVDRNKDLIESIVSDAKNLLDVWSGRKGYHPAEALYALGLAVIASKAVELGRKVSEEDASTILKVAKPGVGIPIFPHYEIIIIILLEPLRFEAPQHYTSLLAKLSERTRLDKVVVSFIFNTLNEILYKYSNKFERLVWPLVSIVKVYSNLLSKHYQHVISILLSMFPQYFDEIKDLPVKIMCSSLSVLREKSLELETIAKALVLAPSLRHEDVEGYVKKYCSINDIIAEAEATLNNLKNMESEVSKLVENNTFMEWIKTVTLDLSEEGVREVISILEGLLTFMLAEYKRDVDRLDEARKLYNKSAEIDKSIGDIANYLVSRSKVLRVDVIKASNLNEYTDVAKGFEDLWNEALKNQEPSYPYFEVSSSSLGEYLVYLASIGRYDDVEKLLNKYAYLLDYDEKVSVLTKLMLKILGYTKTGISSREIVKAFNDDISSRFLPALKLALGIEADVEKECAHLEHSVKQLLLCVDAFLAVKGNSVAIKMLKEWLMDERGLEFYKLVEDLDGKSLVQLLAPKTSNAQLAFMLYSLANGDTDLARGYALLGSIDYKSKPLSRLFEEPQKHCCDVSDERFKLALLKLFYYHI